MDFESAGEMLDSKLVIPGDSYSDGTPNGILAKLLREYHHQHLLRIQKLIAVLQAYIFYQ